VVSAAIRESGASAQCNRRCAARFRCLEPSKHVRRSTACRNADYRVSRQREPFNLALEQRVVTEIVRNAREHSGISNQRNGRKRTSGILEASNELFYEVTRLRRASTISKGENFSTVPESRYEGASRCI
jgi:hypothetical protein